MRKWYRYIPNGTRDFLNSDLSSKRKVERILIDCYESYGYSEIATPTIEFFDVYDIDTLTINPENMYKFTDDKGRLLVLRADNTISVARAIAVRLENAQMPLRLYYCQDTYSSNKAYSGKYNQRTQGGIELIGNADIDADVEVLTCAIDTLNKVGVKNYKIEIGHNGLFKALINKLKLDPHAKEEIRNNVEMKNFAALEDILDKTIANNKEDREVCEIIRRLPRLFGGSEVLKVARDMTLGIENQALDYLEELYKKLIDLGFGDIISIDLAMIHCIDYYTGVVFKGYSANYGDTILEGGRYDNLFEHFDIAQLPAIGFGINVDAVSSLLQREKAGDL